MSDLAPGQVIRLADGRNAVVRFVGDTYFAPGVWVGVELDDGTGKNDGSVQGEKYFDCEPGNGMFVRPSAVTVIAQPPPPPKRPAAAPAAAKKRPSSYGSSSRAASGSLDPNANRRKSMNNPSPSPAGRQSNSLRVSNACECSVQFLANVVFARAVAYQISYETARLKYGHIERLHITDRNTWCDCTGRGSYCVSQSAHQHREKLHGPACETRPATIGLIHARRSHKISEHPALADHQ